MSARSSGYAPDVGPHLMRDHYVVLAARISRVPQVRGTRRLKGRTARRSPRNDLVTPCILALSATHSIRSQTALYPNHPRRTGWFDLINSPSDPRILPGREGADAFVYVHRVAQDRLQIYSGRCSQDFNACYPTRGCSGSRGVSGSHILSTSLGSRRRSINAAIVISLSLTRYKTP